MSKFNPNLNHLFRRGLFDPSRVCEQPLNEPCNANKTRIGCVLQDCCFFMDTCYKKTVPGYLKAFYSLILILLILFWGVLGFWVYKYRRQKKKLADINGVKEDPAEIAVVGTDSTSEIETNQDDVEGAEENTCETAVVETDSTSEIETNQDDVEGAEENTCEIAVVVTDNTSKVEEKHDDVRVTEENTGKTGLLHKEKN